MIEVTHYNSPIGDILIAAKGEKLVGLWIENQKYYLENFTEEKIETQNSVILNKTKKWLDSYFNGDKPNINELSIEFIGTDFRKRIWQVLCEIPYGKTVTYKYIAEKIAKEKGIKTMSAQAVGSAVGHNPISIIVPCHRVVGTDGSLTGYAGGLDKKMYLLKHENANIENLYIN